MVILHIEGLCASRKGVADARIIEGGPVALHAGEGGLPGRHGRCAGARTWVRCKSLAGDGSSVYRSAIRGVTVIERLAVFDAGGATVAAGVDAVGILGPAQGDGASSIEASGLYAASTAGGGDIATQDTDVA